MMQDWKEGNMSHVDEGTLHAYLDGELPSDERTALEAHLGQCAICRQTLAEQRALLERASALLGSTRPVERPAPPFEQLRRAPQRSSWHVRMPFAWAASIAVALGIGYLFRSPEQLTPNAALAPPAGPVALRERAKASPVRQRQGPRADELVRSDGLARTDSYIGPQSRMRDVGVVAMNPRNCAMPRRLRRNPRRASSCRAPLQSGRCGGCRSRRNGPSSAAGPPRHCLAPIRSGCRACRRGESSATPRATARSSSSRRSTRRR